MYQKNQSQANQWGFGSLRTWGFLGLTVIAGFMTVYRFYDPGITPYDPSGTYGSVYYSSLHHPSKYNPCFSSDSCSSPTNERTGNWLREPFYFFPVIFYCHIYSILGFSLISCLMRKGLWVKEVLSVRQPLRRFQIYACVSCRKVSLLCWGNWFLIIPHFKDYMYVLFIPPAYHLITDARSGSRGFIIAYVLLLLPTATKLPFINDWLFLWEYYPLWRAAVLWGIFSKTEQDRAVPIAG